MVWSPALNDATTPQTAFTVKASDGTADNAQVVTVRATVTSVNAAPTIVGSFTVTSVTRNAWKEVTFADLRTGLGATDGNETADSALILQVESLANGQSLKIGTSGNFAGATDYNSTSNKQVITGKSIWWLPASNQTGIVDAIRFTVIDGNNVSSPTQGLVRMNIDTGSNAAPTITATTPISLGSTYGVRLPFTVSYTTLQTLLSPADTDSTYVTFVLTSISNGSIKKGGTTMVAMAGANLGTPVAESQLVPGESMVVIPTSTTTGSAVTLATVRGWDGTAYSANEVTLQATFVAGLNQVPVLTYVKDFTGGAKNTAFTFSYDSLRGNPSQMSQGTERTDAFDAEEVIANKTLQFRVKSVTAGSYLCLNSAATCDGTTAAADAITVDEDIVSNTNYKWVPPAGVTGLQNAFTVVAWDGSAASATPIQVKVYINKDPTFTSSTNIISGVPENTPYTITYDKLFTTFPSADDSTGILGYRLTDVSTGITAGSTLTRYVNGVATAVTAPHTMYPGDQVIWTPPAHVNVNTVPLFQLFKLKVVDAEGASSSEIDVKATVSALNTPPVAISTSGTLTSVARNVAGGKSMTYADIFGAIDFREYDVNTSVKPGVNDAHGIKFRIESVPSGTLRAVNNTGTTINPTPTDPTTMKYLVQSGADNTNTWTQLNWTPPVNALGTYTIMKVRLYDGTDFSNTVVDINIQVTAGNTAPSVSGFTVSPGISENGAQLITYDNLLLLSGASDSENDPIKFKIWQVSSGSVTYKGTTYLTTGSAITPPVVGPGDELVWRPEANAAGTLNAFMVKATDLTTDSSAVQVSVIVGAYNTAPTNLSSYTYTNATRYPNAKFFEITHSSLATNLNAEDVENGDSLLKFRIEELLGGQSVYRQTSGSCATVPAAAEFYPSGTTITNGQSFCWVQPSGVVGSYAALRLSVLDNDNAVGTTQARVSVSISVGTDAVPAYFGNYPESAPTYNVVKSAGTITWTYEELKNLSGAYDTDSSAVSLVITNINANLVSATNGTFTKNSTSLAAWAGTLGQSYNNYVPSSTMIIAPGETVTYQSFSSGGIALNTPTELFRFAAIDSTSVAATDKSIRVSLKSTNPSGKDPTFSYMGPVLLGSKTENVPVSIPYTQFRSHADAHDVNETPVDRMKFLITSVTITNGSVTISKNGAACSAITTGATLFEPGDSICFTPNATGAALATNTIHTILAVQAKDVPDEQTVGSAVNFQVRMP